MDQLTSLQAFEAMLSKYELAMQSHARGALFRHGWISGALEKLVRQPSLPVVLECGLEAEIENLPGDMSALTILMESFGVGFIGWRDEYVLARPHHLQELVRNSELRTTTPDYARMRMDRSWLVQEVGADDVSRIILHTSLDGVTKHPSIRIEFSGGYVTGDATQYQSVRLAYLIGA